MSSFIATCVDKQVNPLLILGVVLNNAAARDSAPVDNPAQALRTAALQLIRNGRDGSPTPDECRPNGHHRSDDPTE